MFAYNRFDKREQNVVYFPFRTPFTKNNKPFSGGHFTLVC